MAEGFGKYDVYAVAGSIYCYRDTNVLKNRFGLRDSAKLRAVEADISLLRQRELLENPIQGRFTASHLCRIHRYLLGDVYSFAGHFRREDIMKGTTRFLTWMDIPYKLTALLDQLREEHWLSELSFDRFTERSAYYFAELNYIHPFREGNGRVQRLYFRQLARWIGHSLNFAAVDSDRMMSATIRASAGVMDDLRQVFEEILK